MSRHRFIRNMRYDDEIESPSEEESLSHSYSSSSHADNSNAIGDMSPGLSAQYLYNYQPKAPTTTLGDLFQAAENNQGKHHQNSNSINHGDTGDDDDPHLKMATVEVRKILGEGFTEKQVDAALRNNNYDVEKAIGQLLDSKSGDYPPLTKEVQEQRMDQEDEEIMSAFAKMLSIQQQQQQRQQQQQNQQQQQQYQKPQQPMIGSPPMYHPSMPVDISSPSFLASSFPSTQRLTPSWAMNMYPEQQQQQQQLQQPQQSFPQMLHQQPISLMMAQQHMAPVQTTFDYVMAPAPMPMAGYDGSIRYSNSKPPYQDTIPSYYPQAPDILLRQTSNDPISDRATSSNHESSLVGMVGRNESGANKARDELQQQQQQQQPQPQPQKQEQNLILASHPSKRDSQQAANPNSCESQDVNTELDISQSHEGRRSSRRRWTPEEDQVVLEAVRKNGPRHWDALAALLHGRNGQHVRLRYHNYLRFTLEDKEREFTPEEDQLILKSVASQNHRWSETAQLIGRSNNAVKNRYYLLVRHLKKTETEQALINESMANSLQRAASSGAGVAGASETQGSSVGDEKKCS